MFQSTRSARGKVHDLRRTFCEGAVRVPKNRAGAFREVKNSEGKETVFKLKKSTALRKMMDAYCQREGLPADGVLQAAAQFQ